jgi:ABC-type sugar transport system substrate-binding protein
MTKKTRRTFLTAAAPALALAAPAAAAQQPSPAPAKRVYRKTTPTSKTVNGEPLYSPELSFGNLVFVSGKGPATGFSGDI